MLGENPLGGLCAGVIVGHIVDLMLGQKILELKHQKYFKAEGERIFREHFIANLFELFGRLCTVDGSINKQERGEALRIATKVFSLNRSDTAFAIKTMSQATHSHKALQTSAVKLFECNKETDENLEMCLQLCFELAASDGVVTSEEEDILHQISSVFGISKKRYNLISRRYIQQAPLDLEKSYAELECSFEDCDKTIKRNYRRLASEYHPDKIIAKDLPQGFITFANQKTKSIRDAYEAIKASRGLT